MARQGPKVELTVQQDQFVRMEANGLSSPEIIKALWGLEKGQEHYHSMECKLTRWRKHPKYTETWLDEVRKADFADYAKSRSTLRKAMNDYGEDKWLAMNAANSVMSATGKKIFGNEEATFTVKVTGMPDIGSPDDNA